MAKGKGERILLIDDDTASRIIARKMLEQVGYSVLESESAEQGLAMALEEVPHLIVLDLVMPGRTGFDFLEDRRAHPSLSNIPVLVLSGNDDQQSIFRARTLGASEYVTKPIVALTITQKARKLLHDRDFVVRNFEDKKESAVANIVVTGMIRAANEAGFLLEAPVKIAPGTGVVLESEFFEKVGFTDGVFLKITGPAKLGTMGQYLNEVGMIGLDPKTVEKIRSVTREWK